MEFKQLRQQQQRVANKNMGSPRFLLSQNFDYRESHFICVLSIFWDISTVNNGDWRSSKAKNNNYN